MPQLYTQSGENSLVLPKRSEADARDLALVKESADVFAKLGGVADGAEPVLLALNEQFPELGVSLRIRRRLERDVRIAFESGVIFHDNPGVELPVAPPESANWVLAIVQSLGVGTSATRPVGLDLTAILKTTVQHANLEIQKHP